MTHSTIEGAKLYMVNIDCVDPQVKAEFYSQALGWEKVHSEAEYSMVSNGAVSIGFGRVEDYQAPAWPDTDHTKRFHLDIQVADLAAAVDALTDLGATVPEHQPGGDRWTVLLDPEGQPFCLFPGA